jgi:hypothetical protein
VVVVGYSFGECIDRHLMLRRGRSILEHAAQGYSDATRRLLAVSCVREFAPVAMSARGPIALVTPLFTETISGTRTAAERDHIAAGLLAPAQLCLDLLQQIVGHALLALPQVINIGTDITAVGIAIFGASAPADVHPIF